MNLKRLLTVCSVFLLAIGTMLAQRTVSGTVSDDTGEPLIGASVVAKGTNVGTTADIDGNYRLEVPAGVNTLVVTYTGYATQEVTLGAGNVQNVTMQEGVMLNEAVVTALGITREERAVGYAVQEVDGEILEGANETNLVQSLAGKVAGLNVINSSGAAGGSSFFTIRGVNSINGNNQPLIVVDGVPIDNSQLRSGSAVASVAFSNRAIDINQSEIANVSVLKGAAATALYGSQAGNGAIIITTKKGASGGQNVSVDFSQDVTFSSISQVPDLQDTYAQGLFGGYRGPETGTGYSYGPRIDELEYANDAGEYPFDRNGSLVPAGSANSSGQPANTYDPYDYFQTGLSSQTNFAIAASNERSNVRFSAGYLAQEGVVPLNEFSKLNFGLNAGSQLNEQVNLSLGVQYANSGGTRIEQGSNTSGVMLGLLRTSPTFDNSNGNGDDAINIPDTYQFADGSQRNYRGGGGYDNPYWTSNNNPLNDEVNRIIANVTAEYKPLEWLTVSYRPGIDYYSDLRKQFFAIGSRTVPTGRVFEDQFFSYRFNSDFIVRADRQITDDLSLNALVGHNLRSQKLDNLFTDARDLVIPGFYDLSNGSNTTIAADNFEVRNQALYASVDLGFQRLLYLSGTLRYEQESTLPIENNSFVYGSVSGSFVFSELIDDQSVFSYGKARASYGTVGLGAFAYATQTYFAAADIGDGWVGGNRLTFPLAGTAGFAFDNLLGNPNLRPEINTSFEAGVDLRFFNDRIGLDFTYYNSEAKDIILSVPVAGSSGFNSQVVNAGILTNKGIEAVLRINPVRTNDFNWDFTANFARNKNTVEQLAEGIDNVFLGGFTGAQTRAVAGQPYGSIFGFGFYRDADGNRVIGQDGFPVLDPTERAFESAQPDFTLGILNSFSYKGLTLSALLDIKQGGVMWNGTKGALYFWGTHQETADLRGTAQVFEGNSAVYDSNGDIVLVDHDDNADTPSIPQTSGENTTAVLIDEGWLAFGNGNGFFGDNTEDFIESTSWVRLRDVTLSYTFDKPMFNDRLRGLTLSVSGRNLWLETPYTGVDPDTNLYGASNAQGLDYFNMPGTQSVTMGLRARF